ncbi:hypothetical protein GPECTOR_28g848 [Gonium pectorale]|uniref:F-box domain-containing protein n=1 Tax=Gonium pectorale TaxID=33097 RepID=A0A150GF43_GONPE|nr:hypothetical protein GPECTOR_28g848 [Gonium pectorale]|eukprot:KXZ48438.1 hypothetical protein GPECTOR_28g848 [Gonium pectorale]
MQQTSEPESNTSSLNGLPPEIVDAICCHLSFDGHALLRLGETSRSWRSVVSDAGLWKRLNAVRFGDHDVTPPPARPAAALPGWAFFPGMDSQGSDCARPEDAAGELSPTSLAARANQLAACAFNTNGWIKSRLTPIGRWVRFSYTPGEGLYVRQEVVLRGLGLPPRPPLPARAEPQATPPDIPGWLFYPLMESPGHDIRHPATGEDNFMSSCSSLEEVASVAAAWPGCVAFTTAGCLKSNVEPQVHWRYKGGGATSWAGLYMREGVVRERRMRPPPPQGTLCDPLLRYFQRGHRRLRAARDVDVTWLNGTYLARRPDPEPPQQAQQPVASAPVAAAEPGGHGAGGGDGGGGGGDRGGDTDDDDDSDSDFEYVDELGMYGPPGAVWLQRPEPPLRLVEAIPAAAAAGAAAAGMAGAAADAAGAQQVVALRSVCWLELNGRFEGVGPGRYRVSWWLRVAPDCDVADMEPLHLQVLLDAARPALGGSAAAAAVADLRPGALAALDVGRAELMAHAGRGWYEQPGGEFEVPRGAACDLVARLWNHSGDWKTGMMFREVALALLDAA